MQQRVFFVVAWAFVLFYFTCSLDPFTLHISGFHFQPHPHFKSLLKLDLHPLHPFWLIQKIGHFSGFLIMDALLVKLFRRRNAAAIVTVLFAITTEIFQLYFMRDGRLYDMVIDSLGVALSYFLQARSRIR
ncbi:VanZ family protein [Alicyclobacillus fodiniaquatilis]|uniref:VanZ family protein n=1 Tax=Alicyclobacillus fodiniaquatilis TaxID=1661150 RepID=A0ABW4JGF1_9BACL